MKTNRNKSAQVLLSMAAFIMMSGNANACMVSQENVIASGTLVVDGICKAQVSVDEITKDNGMCSIGLMPASEVVIEFNPRNPVHCNDGEAVKISGVLGEEGVSLILRDGLIEVVGGSYLYSYSK